MSTAPLPIGGFRVTLGSGPYPTVIQGASQTNPFATNTWWIDGTNGSNSNTGTSPDKPLATLQFALASSVAGDVFIIAPGTYTLTAAFVPLARQTFMAAVQFTRKPSVIIVSSAIADMINVDVSGVQFYGIEFQAGDDTCDNLINVAKNAAVTGLIIADCVFNGADKASVVGIKVSTAATFAGKNLVVVRCLFRDLTGTHILVGTLGFEYSYIAYNHFAIDVNSGTAISLGDTGAFATGKGYIIEHNDFTGFDATADEVGITIAGTENTTGAGIIRNNYFAYLAASAITVDKLSLSEVNNYVGDAATGGTLVDPGT